MLLAQLADHVARDDSTAPAASRWIVLGAAALAVVVMVLLGQLGDSARTIHHEGGHALIGTLLGSAVTLRAYRRGGGLTEAIGLGWLSRIIFHLVGYLAPSAFGLLAAVLVTAGQPKAALVITVILLGLALLVSVGFYTFAVVTGTGLLLLLVVRYAGDGTQMLAGLTWSWFLLIGGVVDAVGLTQVRRRMRAGGLKDRDSDAAQLRSLTLIPAALWSVVFIAGSLVALLVGGSLLLGLEL